MEFVGLDVGMQFVVLVLYVFCCRSVMRVFFWDGVRLLMCLMIQFMVCFGFIFVEVVYVLMVGLVFGFSVVQLVGRVVLNDFLRDCFVFCQVLQGWGLVRLEGGIDGLLYILGIVICEMFRVGIVFIKLVQFWFGMIFCSDMLGLVLDVLEVGS